MKHRRILWVIISMLALLCVFVACQKNEGAPKEDDFLKIDENYCLVKPEKVGSEETKISSRLCSLLREKYGDFEIKQDYYKDKGEIRDCEILVGNTNRSESQTEFFETDQYTVRVVGKKIVIKAGSIPDGLLEGWTSSKVICSYKLDFSNQQYFVEHVLPNNTHIYKVRAFVSYYSY